MKTDSKELPGDERPSRGRLWASKLKSRFFIAAAVGDVEDLKRCEELGVDTRSLARSAQANAHFGLHGAQGKSALMVAAREQKTDSIRWLIPRSDPLALSVNVRIAGDGGSEGAGYTALMLAAYNGYQEGVMLLAPCSEIFARHATRGDAIEMARKNGHAELAAWLGGYALAARVVAELSESSATVAAVERNKKPRI